MNARDIQELACQHWCISRTKLLSKQRVWRYVRPRQAAMYALYTFTAYTSPQIGRLFGRDHTTVLHALKRVQATLDNEVAMISGRPVYPDPAFADDLRDFLDRVAAMKNPRMMIRADIVDSREPRKRVMHASDFELPSVEEKQRAREQEKARKDMMALQEKPSSPFPSWARFDDNVKPTSTGITIIG